MFNSKFFDGWGDFLMDDFNFFVNKENSFVLYEDKKTDEVVFEFVVPGIKKENVDVNIGDDYNLVVR